MIDYRNRRIEIFVLGTSIVCVSCGIILCVFDPRGFIFVFFGGLGGIAALNLAYFKNLRMHLNIINHNLMATQAAVSLSRARINHPIFFLNHTVAPDFVQIVAELIRRFPVSNVLELGSGASTSYVSSLLEHFQGHGNIISLEDSEAWVLLVQREIDALNTPNVTTQVLHAPLKENKTGASYYDIESLKLLEVAPFDLVIVDGPGDVRLRTAVFTSLETYISPGTMFVFDDGYQPALREGIREWIKQHPGWKSREYSTVKGTWVVWNQEHRLLLPLP